MPRAPGYAPPPSSVPPESFDSLQELADYSAAPRPSTGYLAPLLPYSPRSPDEQQSRKLIVCHDYKGGYSERADERGYTFSWWHLTDTFIYFSHRRVAPPPPAWIRAAHRNGTKILGTLIFEWDAGKADFDLLLGAGDLREVISTETADQLVDLAVDRGFEGWLVNVEVPLGVKGSVGAEEHAEALLIWLRYLRNETRRRIAGGATMWYDGANVEGVRWQNRLSSLNSPFFEATDSIFINYFWREDHVKATVGTLQELKGRGRDEVAFGLDVFGRGQFGGGGFSSWRAVDLLEQSSTTLGRLAISSSPLDNVSTSSADSIKDFSLALFAPGWTVESEHLGHSLSTREAWQKWWEDELYLWTGSSPGPNVEREERRMEVVRREERGVQRARELAVALSPGRDNVTAPSLFDYNSPLPPLAGSFRPLTSYFSKPRPPPRSSSFYTNYSTGAGHHFYLEGKRVLDSASGWTDVDFSFPFPSLAIPSPSATTVASLSDDDAWMGGFSLKLSTGDVGGSASIMPISPTSVILPQSQHLTATVVWKPLSTVERIQIVVNCDFSSVRTISSAATVEVHDLETEDLAQGWKKTSALVTLVEGASAATISSLGLAIPVSSSLSTLLVGSLSLSPSTSADLPAPRIVNLRWTPAGHSLRWDLGRRVSTSNSPPKHDSSAQTWPSFMFYILWHHTIGGEVRFLGTTSAREFEVNRVRLGSGTVVCRGVREDGSLDSAETSCNI